MVRKRICYLIEETTKARGVFQEPETEEKKRFCTERSVTRSEYYNAENVGIQPEIVLKLTRASEYGKELRLRYQGQIYDIIRNYETPDGGIELTIARSDVNA